MNIFFLHPFIVDERLQVTSKNEFARSIKNEGHSINTLVGYRYEQIPLEGFSKVSFKKVKCRVDKLALYFMAVRAIFKSSYDVLLISNSVAWLLPLIYIFNKISRHPFKIIADIRTIPVDEVRPLNKELKKLKFRLELFLINCFSDGLSVITEATREKVYRMVTSIDRICVWGSGVHVKDFQPNLEEKEFRQNSDVLRVIYHGHLSRERGLDTIIKACEEARRIVPNIELTLIGSGPFLNQLKVTSKKLDWFKVLPPVPYNKVRGFLVKSHIGIVPLPDLEWWQLSSPLKLMEYIASDLFIIGSDIRPHKELKEFFEDINLFTPSNNHDLAMKIIDCANRLQNGKLPVYGEKEFIDWKSKAVTLLKYIEGIG